MRRTATEGAGEGSDDKCFPRRDASSKCHLPTRVPHVPPRDRCDRKERRGIRRFSSRRARAFRRLPTQHAESSNARNSQPWQGHLRSSHFAVPRDSRIPREPVSRSNHWKDRPNHLPATRQFPGAVPARGLTADAAPSERRSPRLLDFGYSRFLPAKSWSLPHLVEWKDAGEERAATDSKAVRE